ncbi:low-density lipoprotein receptor-related protein 8-like [Sinocyclocheilus rhinocerous]|uniref:low-density lipoprotein receptor-related protein 8-like n=1 Tax=Sinocyclocheilus rhinocerous TaxID=307959 RepID=UPI0007B98945|nr:PREDICTED: low-density lipoprotein receptor-related protein 8-like [Sinocyclocheilus rhinocerous]
MWAEIGKLVFLHFLVSELYSAKGADTECEDGQFQCNNKRCIPTIWRCDDDDDCSDNSDEENCLKNTCAPSEFACANGQCVPGRWRCDGEPECPDGSDEADATCTVKQTCPPEKFDCGGKCVSLSWRCDGERDCENGEDEADCAADARSCSAGEFQCRNHKCLAPVYVCDGDDDCGDSSDEEKCSPPTCGPHEFRCNSSECVPQPWTCDGDPDCADGSDEWAGRCGGGSGRPAPPPTRRLQCGAGEFRCSSGECVKLSWRCDRDPDCKDKSDEADCPLLTCRPDEFQCGDGSCIHGIKQCNKIHDCLDKSDEAGCVNATKCEGPLKFLCRNGECIDGSKVCDNVKDCKDRSDEPKKECSKKTILQGSDNGKSPYLMFTNRHEIRRIDLVKRDYTQVVPTQKNAVAIDIDVVANRMYWCDRFQHKIYSAYIHEASDPSRHVTLIDSDLHSPEGLALDWVQHNLYWTDSGDRTISVASVDGSRRRVLISTDLSEPRAIAVDPERGFMYWSDWGIRARIEKAGMNGVDRQVLVSEDIEWPNGITLDVVGKRLYWVDSKLHLICSVDLNGAHRRVILSSRGRLGHPYALAVFEDRVYWTDREKEAVYSANRLTGQDVTSLAEHLNDPHDIVVFHELSQPNENTSPLMDEELSPDTRQCVLVQNETGVTPTAPINFTMETGAGRAPESPAAMTSQSDSMAETTLSSLLTSSLEEPAVSSNTTAEHSPTQASSTTPDSLSNLSHHSGNELFLLGRNLTVAVLGVVIPIVPIVATVVFGVVCAGVYLVYRNWRRNSTKSMNFDNPVYRKTTGETEEDEIHIGRTDRLAGHHHPYPGPVVSMTPVGTGTCPPFIALPLGTGLPDPATHWYTEQPTISSTK